MIRLILINDQESSNKQLANVRLHVIATSLTKRLDGTGDHKIDFEQVDNKSLILVEIRYLEQLRSFCGMFTKVRFKFADEPESGAKSLDELIKIVTEGGAFLETIVSELLDVLSRPSSTPYENREFLLATLQILRLVYWSLRKNKYSAPEVKLRILETFLRYQRDASSKSPSPNIAEISLGNDPKELPTSDQLKDQISAFQAQWQR